MGAMGALYFGSKYPDLFYAVASRSGSIDFDQEKINLGEFYSKNQTALPMFRLDYGINDEWFAKANPIVHQKMIEAKIPHVYQETPDGHDFIPYIASNIEWAARTILNQTSMNGLEQNFKSRWIR
jgi:enterochelin esterase-like enzyme